MLSLSSWSNRGQTQFSRRPASTSRALSTSAFCSLLYLKSEYSNMLQIVYNWYSDTLVMLITVAVFHSFVVAEILLHSFRVVYPPYLAMPVESIYSAYMWCACWIIKVIAIETAMLNGCLRWLMRFLVSSLAVVVVPLTSLLSIKRNRKCPPPSNPLLFKTATTLTHMIRQRQVTSEQVVTAYIERCKEVNPYLNAIVEPRYDMALKEARNIDKMLQSCDKNPEDLAKEYPLLGIPITVKESIAVEGMSNDSGCVKPFRDPAKKDATTVRLARAAGAIPIAVSNTPQLCMNWETYNNVTGLTMNPYDQKRTVGGSSGGEAALLGSGASLLGIGSDIGGSLRLPSMFNGVFGHKPTPRVVSIEGHVPDSLDPDWDEYFALGPMVRYAEDLPLFLNAISLPDGVKLPLDQVVDVKNLTFYYMEGDGSNVTSKIGSNVQNAMAKIRTYFSETHKLEVKELKIKNMEHMWEISARVLMGIDHVKNVFTHPEKREQLVSVWPEVLKKMCGMSDSTFTAVVYGPLKKFFDSLPKRQMQEISVMLESIKAEFDSVLTENTVLFYPTYPDVAHIHYRVFYKFLNLSYLTVFNVLGLPVTNCPLGLTPSGLPVGVQVVANKCCDHLTMAVARELELAFGGWVPPNGKIANC